MPYNVLIYNKPMNYTPEQISQIVLKVLKEVETPDILDLSIEEKIKLAKDPNTSQESLRILATDENSYVRRRVARNQNTPQELLRILATDEDSYVRLGVAENQNTSQETLSILATDTHSYVRNSATENPNYKKQTLELTPVQYNALKKLIESGQDETLKGIL